MGPHLLHNHFIKDPWDLPCSLANITWDTPVLRLLTRCANPSLP